MYITPIERTNSVAMREWRELDSKICGDAFVWRANLFICDELHLNGIAAVFAAFAEELQTTINNSVGIISYLTYMSRGFINIDGMGVSKWRPDVGEKNIVFYACSLHAYQICGTQLLRTFPIQFLMLCCLLKKQDLSFYLHLSILCSVSCY